MVGDEFQVNTNTTGSQMYSSVAINGNDQAVVAWSGSGAAGANGVFGQRYSLNGTGANALGVMDSFSPTGDDDASDSPSAAVGLPLNLPRFGQQPDAPGAATPVDPENGAPSVTEPARDFQQVFNRRSPTADMVWLAAPATSSLAGDAMPSPGQSRVATSLVAPTPAGSLVAGYPTSSNPGDGANNPAESADRDGPKGPLDFPEVRESVLLTAWADQSETVPAHLLAQGSQAVPFTWPTTLCDAYFADPAWTNDADVGLLVGTTDGPEQSPEAAPLLATLALTLFASPGWKGQEETDSCRKARAGLRELL
jgi:hypothetical protein